MCVGGVVVVVGRRQPLFVLPTIGLFRPKRRFALLVRLVGGWRYVGPTESEEGLLSHSRGQQATATDGKSAWKVPDLPVA